MTVGLVLLVIACTGSASAQDNPLVEAVHKGDPQVLERLIKDGADVNARDRNANTPLASAALLGDVPAVRMLLDHGADLNAPGSFGAPPLVLACMAGSPEIVKMLLDKGADTSFRDILGKNASTYAAENSNTGVSELLIQHERSRNAKIRNLFRSFNPVIGPVAFKIGPLSVRWYGLMYLLGFVVAAVIVRSELVRRGGPVPTETVAVMVLYGLIGVIVGARLGAVLIYYPSYFFAHPWQVFALWRGGMSFHGGLIGIIVAGWILLRRNNLSFPEMAEMADIAALAAPIVIMLVKIGNFINGELVGTVTTVPWGVVFPRSGSLPRHPSQLYEAFLEGLVLFAVLWLSRLKARRPGEVFALFLVLYGFFRFTVEFFREPDTSIVQALQWLTTGQILSILMIIAGAGLFIFLYRAGVVQESRTRYPQEDPPL